MNRSAFDDIEKLRARVALLEALLRRIDRDHEPASWEDDVAAALAGTAPTTLVDESPNLQGKSVDKSADLHRPAVPLPREGETVHLTGVAGVALGTVCGTGITSTPTREARLETLWREWLDGDYDGQDLLRRVRIEVLGPLKAAP